MKPYCLPLVLTLGFAVVSGIAMGVGIRAAGRWEGYLQQQPGVWEPGWLQQVGWRLCLPSYVAVEAIPRYSCTPTWHPAYRAGFVLLWVGYTGGFWMISVVGGLAIRRRFGMPFPS